jgi:hypothetical protein
MVDRVVTVDDNFVLPAEVRAALNNSTTVTWDAPSIPAGGFVSTTFTWTGVVPGQWIGVGAAVDLGDGVQVYATITISGTVRITIRNLTGSAVDPASTTYRLYRTQIV